MPSIRFVIHPGLQSRRFFVVAIYIYITKFETFLLEFVCIRTKNFYVLKWILH